MITKEGIAESEKLYFGNYELRETRQPQGYILSEETYPIKLEYKDQLTEVALLETEIKNYPVKIKIHTKAEVKKMAIRSYLPMKIRQPWTGYPVKT